MSIKMRALKLMGMVLLTMMMCVTFASCGDDENGAATSAIEGTWSYTSTIDEDMRSGKFTFKADGGLIWEDDEISSDCSYTLNDDKLKIILNHDDYIEGTISISGNQATYKYTWHDYAGEWDSDTEYTMTLIKQ
jgi:hypothetical protein